MDRCDVAIVGAGPAGSSAAISLARRGYSVVLVDKHLFPRAKLCGDFLNPINWALFDRLGVVDAILSLEHERVTALCISTLSGAEATVPFPSQEGQSLFGLGLRRSYLDDLLLQRAEREGATVRQGSRVRGLRRERDGWSMTVRGHSTDRRLHAAFLIGADGRNSWVAHQLGLARPSESRGRFLAFQLHLRGVQGVKGDVQIHLFPGGYAGLVGLGGGTTNLCFTIEKSRVKEDPSIEVLFERWLYRNSRLKESLRDSEIAGGVRSAYPVYFAPRPSYGDAFLLAGDAARVTEPVTGEGVYFALKSGILAAEAAAQALATGDLSARRLAGYHDACRRAFSLRQGINGLIRALVYRPPLLTPLIRLSSRTYLPARPLLNLVCRDSTGLSHPG